MQASYSFVFFGCETWSFILSENVLNGESSGRKTRRKEITREIWGRWEDNIKTDLREVGYEGVEWIRLAQNKEQRRAVVNTVMNVEDP
jgi:hypothetical protein